MIVAAVLLLLFGFRVVMAFVVFWLLLICIMCSSYFVLLLPICTFMHLFMKLVFIFTYLFTCYCL